MKDSLAAPHLALPCADKYGRRSVAYGGAVGVVVLTLLAALAPNFWLHLLLRVLSGSCGAGMCLAGYVIVSCARTP